MSDTPETDACWDDKECNILKHARRLERERDEQCRLLGMSAERECDLRGKIERLELNQQVEALKEESSRWEKQWKAWENKWKCAVEMTAQSEADKCSLEAKLAAERALADRLAEGLRKMAYYSEALILRIQDRSDINFKTLNECIDLFNEWKEARND